MLTGWLWKKGGGRSVLGTTSWRKRWCNLKKTRIYYSELPTSHEINFIALTPSSTVQIQDCDFGFGFSIFSVTRVYHLSAPTESERTVWITAIQEAIRETADYMDTNHYENLRYAMRTETVKEELLDIVVVGAELDVERNISVVLKEKDGRRFQTWYVSKVKQVCSVFLYEWDDVDATFLKPADNLLFRVYEGTHTGGTKIGEGELMVSSIQKGVGVDNWFPLRWKGKLRGRLHLKLHSTFTTDEDALLFQRGIPSTILPQRLDSGDILLCNTNHMLTYTTKLFTWSQWDHVAVVIRWRDNKLKILEATIEGVAMYRFEERVSDLIESSKIAIRRLRADRGPSFWNSLYHFILEVNGRPYKTSKIELIQAVAQTHCHENLTSLFCSELCAAFYKRVGVLNDDRSSNCFLPKTWADKTNEGVSLINGAKLQRKIIFKPRPPTVPDRSSFDSTLKPPPPTTAPKTAQSTPSPAQSTPSPTQSLGSFSQLSPQDTPTVRAGLSSSQKDNEQSSVEESELRAQQLLKANLERGVNWSPVATFRKMGIMGKNRGGSVDSTGLQDSSTPQSADHSPASVH